MKSQHYLYLAFATLLTLSACGGGGGGGGVASSGGIGGTGIVATGVMTNGSIILNGIHYEDGSVNNVSDDPLGGSSVTPDDGKVVKLRGRRNDDGINGSADTVEVENEVRGTAQSKNAAASPQSFVVVGQTVTIDDLTIYSNFSVPKPANPLSELIAGTSFVEVHGLRLADGSIRASRVELVGATNPGGVDELRGTVGTVAPAGDSFQLVNGATSVTVNFSGTPAVTTGQLVEVHGSFSGGTFSATRVDIEDLEDTAFQPENNGEVEREGFVADCAAPGCTTFTINGQSVQTAGDVRFENGAEEDLINGARIEAEGHFVSASGTLLADKIKFKRVRVEVTGNATITGVFQKGDPIGIMGITILTNDFTEVDTSDSITNERLEIRGYVDSAGQVIAERVKDTGGGGDNIVRGPVTTEVGNTLTILGISVNVGSAIQFQDAQGNPTNLAGFLGLVTPAPSPGGTAVKAKGAFAGGTLTATEAEIED